MDPRLLMAAAIVLLAAALLVLGMSLLRRALYQTRSQRVVEQALVAREQPDFSDALAAAASPRRTRIQSVFDGTAELGQRWESGRIGSQLLAAEDRQLLDRCGFENPERARAQFVFIRLVLTVGAPVAAWFALRGGQGTAAMLAMFVAFALGYMIPKWVLRGIAAGRVRQAAEELPMLIDLLRLLQGVGLSIDQSLHIIVTEFRRVMPVLAGELEIAVNQHARGLSREQSLQRLANGFGIDDLGAIARLIVQVDRHGGAVQEPLKQFSERVRERRRMELKERVGRLTVKMTGVMVLTLLPALLIVTAGAGFLALFRGLSGLGN
ncbi:type II secretion system F family protein [Pigmentiphaga soli]|uniref:Type II secretion system F family protein n=1 Tax=Pigmentiphaga soli TaxID=1007095 RepID=A0ABP8H554_9BURK